MLSLVVPTYCERDNILPLVKRIHQALGQQAYELIIVDDNSPDKTSLVALSLANKYPIRVITRERERGLATAVLRGFGEAKGDILGVIDADLQHPPELLPKLLGEISNGADIAIASRYITSGGFSNWSLKRKALSQAARIITWIVPQAREVRDPSSGYFLLRRAVVDRVEFNPIGYKTLLEILVRGKHNHTVEVPYTAGVRQYGSTKLSLAVDIDFIKHLYRLVEFGELRRFLKFCLVGLSGVAVNMSLLWLLTEAGGLFYILSAAIAIETSVVTNFILNDTWTFRDRRVSGVRRVLGRGAKFNLVSIMGLGINMTVLLLLTEGFGVMYLVSNIFGIGAATSWNFLVNRRWTWQRKA